MKVGFNVLTLNTESGSRPGFHQELQKLVESTQPDVIALQEVHRAYTQSVPKTFMPLDPGKRIHPMRLHLYNELVGCLKGMYEPYFAPHIRGLHDLERSVYPVAYGQAMFIKRASWQTICYRSDMVFGQFDQLNEEMIAGKPCGKVAQSVLLKHQHSEHSVLVTNVHGFWSRHGKVDTRHRFYQNRGINQHGLAMCRSATKPHVLVVGDLNYRRDMKALEHLRRQRLFGENGGYVLNLDEVWEIHTTRTKHYSSREQQPDADYLIACAKLAQQLVYLKTDMDFPSDHAPLSARFVW